VVALVAVALMATACSDDRDGDDVETEVTTVTTARDDPVAAAETRVEEAESGVADSQEALEAAGEQFCADAESYLEVLDRYGKLFTDDAATVGDVQTLGADLVDPRETVAASVNEVEGAKTALAEAELELAEAQAALVEAIATASSVPASSTAPATTTMTTLVPQATIERVQQAEDDLAQAGQGITAATPLAEATAEYNSAAFALQIAWLRLFYDAGCLSDEQEAKAVEQVTAYTAALQTELQQVGYYEGAIDGIYGPATVEAVKRLQADSDLPETGFVDQATAEALDELLAELELQTASDNLTHSAAVQTVLTLTGFWQGPIDGVWTDELTVALQEFQTSLGVEPTGVVDAATLAAFELALAERQAAPAAPPTTPAATTPVETTLAAGPDEETTVLVADSDLGQVLTAGDGMTVYVFMPDAQSAPTCTDSCADAWPPLTVDDASQVTGGDGIDASLLGTAEHPTAGIQVTYNGWPLYFFAGDAVPGDTNGQGQGGVWHVLDPSGNAIDNN
jgi:predicted lipoprotein with Yx(FWY)xxD motif